MNLPTDLFILQDNAKLVDACRMHNEGVTVRMQQWVGHACSRVLRRYEPKLYVCSRARAGDSFPRARTARCSFAAARQYLLKAPRNPYLKSVKFLSICSLPCRQQRVRRRIVGHPPSFPVSHQPSQVARVEASRLLLYIYIYIYIIPFHFEQLQARFRRRISSYKL